MEVQVENISELTKKITITLPSSQVQNKLNESYDKLKKESKMKGFRRGKIPRSIIVKNYKGQVEGEVGEKMVQETYFDAIESEKVEPVVHPDIKDFKYNDDGSFTYIAEVDVKPEFELAQYKGLEVEKDEILVTDEEIQLQLEDMRKNIAALQSVEDRPVQSEDVVMVDFQGYENGKEIPQVKNNNYSVDVGSGNMGPEFEEKLIGMKKGDKGKHEIDFPEHHPNPILKGKKVEFHVEVKDIKERILPELDDEFAKDSEGDANTLEELKSSIKETLIKQHEERAEGQVTDGIMQKLLDNHEFPVPNRLVAFEIEQMIKQTEGQLEKAGMSLEAAGLSKEKLAEENAEVAAKRVRGDFILKKIGETEDIKVEDEDMERGFQRIGSMYNMPIAEVKKYFQNRDDLLPFVNELLNEKILAFLREETNFSIKSPEQTEETKDQSEAEGEEATEK